MRLVDQGLFSQVTSACKPAKSTMDRAAMIKEAKQEITNWTIKALAKRDLDGHVKSGLLVQKAEGRELDWSKHPNNADRLIALQEQQDLRKDGGSVTIIGSGGQNWLKSSKATRILMFTKYKDATLLKALMETSMEVALSLSVGKKLPDLHWLLRTVVVSEDLAKELRRNAPSLNLPPKLMKLELGNQIHLEKLREEFMGTKETPTKESKPEEVEKSKQLPGPVPKGFTTEERVKILENSAGLLEPLSLSTEVKKIFLGTLLEMLEGDLGTTVANASHERLQDSIMTVLSDHADELEELTGKLKKENGEAIKAFAKMVTNFSDLREHKGFCEGCFRGTG